jgi:hypothetical protein
MRVGFVGSIRAVFAPLAPAWPLTFVAMGLLACGGGAKNGTNAAATSPTAAQSTEAPGGNEGAAGAGAGGAPDTTGSQTSTTTMTLGKGGDLSGAKLSSSSTTTVEGPVQPGAPRPTPGSSEPGRGTEDIRVAVMARRDDARACYDRALKDHPGMEGSLTIKWVIDPKGNVTEAEVDPTRTSIHEPAVTKCVIDVIKQIRFPESPKGFETRANYPFNFNPRSGGKLGAPPSGQGGR